MPAPTVLPHRPHGPISEGSSGGHALAVHRCRFLDYAPSAITAIAFPPLALPSDKPSSSARLKNARQRIKRKFGVMAVGRANGNIELYEWAVNEQDQEREYQSPQAWVLSKILHGPTGSKVESLVFTIRHPYLLSHDEVPALEELRLFSSGGGSEVLEWDVASGTVKRNLNSQGGVIWSMAANPSNTVLALGCEDGCVRLLDIASDELIHLRRFDRIKSRILSLAWGPPVPQSKQRRATEDDSDDDEDIDWTDEWLVTGGSDSALRKWNVKNGRAMDRMSTDKVRGERTLVWAVGVLPDGTIVSGDSLGTVKFWDGQTCTQQHSFSAHGADVLCLAVTPDGHSVFTSGVDQKCCLFSRVKLSASSASKSTIRLASHPMRWVLAGSKRMHSHDVRALASWPPPSHQIRNSSSTPTSSTPSFYSGIAPILASGGLDASLVLTPAATAGEGSAASLVNPLATSNVSTFEDAYHRRLAYPTGVSPNLLIANTVRLVVATQEARIGIWRIVGRARVPGSLEAALHAADAMDVDSLNDGKDLELHKVEEEPHYELLLEMDLDTMTNVSATAVTNDGRWLAVSDAYEVKLFELLVAGDGSLRPKRVKSLMPAVLSHFAQEATRSETEPEGASALGFTPDSGKLVLAMRRSAKVLLVDLTQTTEEGALAPRVLRAFDHHARHISSISKRRVMKSLPVHANGVNGNGTHGSAEESEAESSTDAEKMNSDGEDDDNDNDFDEGESLTATVTRLTLSPDGQWLATSDTAYRTHVFNLDSIQHHTLLPTSPAPITAIAFSPSPALAAHHADTQPMSMSTASSTASLTSSSDTLLVLSHSDASIAVFDVEARCFAPWASHLSRRAELPKRWTSLHDGVLGIEVEPPTEVSAGNGGGRHALFWGSTWVCRVTLDAPPGWGDLMKKRRRDISPVKSKSKTKQRGRNQNQARPPTKPMPSVKQGKPIDDIEVDLDRQADEEAPTNFKLVTRYRPILRAGFLGPGELVIVERPLVDVLRTLPPAFFKPRYGS